MLKLTGECVDKHGCVRCIVVYNVDENARNGMCSAMSKICRNPHENLIFPKVDHFALMRHYSNILSDRIDARIDELSKYIQ